MEELEEVYLANNYISSLEGLQDHRFLQTIDLEANDLTSVEEIQHLDQLTSLRNLNLRKNPIEGQSHIAFPPQAPNASDYTPLQLTQYLIIYLLPCIAIYNGIPVPPEEKVRASNIYQPPMVVTDAILHTQDVMRKLRSYVRIQASDLALSKRFRPIVLAGPAGSGKRTLTQRLLSDFPHLFGLCVSHTTRKPRPGEENGVHYHFVTKADMQAMNEDGQFVEVVSFFGNWYGNSFHSIYKVAMEGKICIMDLEMEVITTYELLYIILVTNSGRLGAEEVCNQSSIRLYYSAVG